MAGRSGGNRRFEVKSRSESRLCAVGGDRDASLERELHCARKEKAHNAKQIAVPRQELRHADVKPAVCGRSLDLPSFANPQGATVFTASPGKAYHSTSASRIDRCSIQQPTQTMLDLPQYVGLAIARIYQTTGRQSCNGRENSMTDNGRRLSTAIYFARHADQPMSMQRQSVV